MAVNADNFTQMKNRQEATLMCFFLKKIPGKET